MNFPENPEEKRRGRPPMRKEEARSERIVTFLTPEERSLLVLRADASGQTLSAAAHELIACGLQDD